MKNFDVEDYVLSNLENAKKGTTGQISATCVFCEKHGSFYIDIKSGNYICFKCQSKGKNLVGVVSKVEGINWYKAKEFIVNHLLEERRKETLPSLKDKILSLKITEQDEVEEKKIFKLPKEFIPVFKKGIWKYPLYLKQRKIKRKTAKNWGLGFCNFGRYKNRVVIPIKSPNGRSFTSRDITGNLIPKYLNPPCWFQSHLLLGWPHIEPKRDLTLVEGPLDAIRLWQHGIQAVALTGKVLHSEQIKVLATCPSDISITIMLDPEERTAPIDVAKQLFFRFEQIYIAKLPDGVDPGSSTKEQAEEAYDDSVLFSGERSKELSFKIANLRSKLKKVYS